ncbi:GDSL-type esterase/lipase family protein [Puniceicoccaceae bacterium K14]|nr:GDSL-type esterase/lipase family protein [Puniceicoccaceae bacterium K14]
MAIIQNGIRFFNTEVLEEREESTGYLLPRIKKEFRDRLSPRGQFVGMCSIGVEIQFVTDARDFRITLSTPDPELTFVVYCGELEHTTFKIPGGQIVTTHIAASEQLALIDKEIVDGAYDSSVWRIVIQKGSAIFHGLDTFGSSHRAPSDSELPQLTWLAYGSSITNSTGKGYPHQAARELGVQIANKGMSGACRVEQEIVDQFTQVEWDFATCELGVNMRGDQLLADQFEDRVNYLLDQFSTSHPGKPIGLITLFPNDNHYFKDMQAIGPRHQAHYSDVLRKLAAERAGEGVFLIEGFDVLDRFTGLYVDLLHPCDYGHIRMGLNLARILKEKLPELLK